MDRNLFTNVCTAVVSWMYGSVHDEDATCSLPWMRNVLLHFFITAQIAQVACPFEQHWLGNWGNLGINRKEIEKKYRQLEELRERRPPWPRQIITLILPTVKMLSLGCKRLPTPLKKKKKKKKRFWIITCTTIWVSYHHYGVFLLIYSSYNTQITTKI